MSSKFVFGTPSAVLIPARRYRLTHVGGSYSITINIAADLMDTSDVGRKVQAVKYRPEDHMDVIIDFGAINKILFASKAYPNLPDNQIFVISNILLDKAAGELTVVGNIVEMKE